MRREEVAAAAGVSVEYYARIEQNRATRPSAEVVEAVCGALGLSAGDRRHAHLLAGTTAEPQSHTTRNQVHLRQLIDSWPATPAMLIGRDFTVHAANAAAAAVFFDFAGASPRDRNLARFLFLDPEGARRYRDWEDVAADTCGQLRVALAQDPQHPGLTELIAELSEQSGHFRRLWAAHPVAERGPQRKRLWHRTVGEFCVDIQVLIPVDAGELRLILLSAPAGSADDDALRLLMDAERPAVALVPDDARPGRFRPVPAAPHWV